MKALCTAKGPVSLEWFFLDDATITKLMTLVEADNKQDAASTKQGFEIAYKITGATAVGLVVLGVMVGAVMPMLGVGGLVACVSYGLYLAAGSIVVDDDPPNNAKANIRDT